MTAVTARLTFIQHWPIKMNLVALRPRRSEHGSATTRDQIDYLGHRFSFYCRLIYNYHYAYVESLKLCLIVDIILYGSIVFDFVRNFLGFCRCREFVTWRRKLIKTRYYANSRRHLSFYFPSGLPHFYDWINIKFKFGRWPKFSF